MAETIEYTVYLYSPNNQPFNVTVHVPNGDFLHDFLVDMLGPLWKAGYTMASIDDERLARNWVCISQ